MEIKQRTLPALFEARCRLSTDRIAAFYLRENNSWQSVSWFAYLQNVNQISEGLNALSIGKGDCVAIMAPTSLYWEYAQMGALAIGCVVAGIDQNYPIDQMEHVFLQLNPVVLFIQNRESLSKVPLAIQEKIKLIISFENISYMERVRSIETFFLANKPSKAINIDLDPEDEAVIVFSSGTTGMPKAICYTHSQVITAIDAISNIYPDLDEDTVLFCWLPLANLFQRIVNFCAIKLGAVNYFLSNPRDLMFHIKRVNPHILIGVPKIYFRIQQAILNSIQEKNKFFRLFLNWALSQTHNTIVTRLKNYKSKETTSSLSFILDKLVISRIRQVFGSRLKYLISGSAPMPLWLLEWYEGIGLPVFEAYGVSESIIPIAMNRQGSRKLGSVGRPLVNSKIGLSSDQEILISSSGVFKRYWNSEQDQLLNQARLKEYWHTNDLGYLDEDGFLFLTGRKSEVFKTVEGKWISPSKIEERLLYLDYVDQSLVFCLGIGKVAAILSVNQEKYFQRLNIQESTIDGTDFSNSGEFFQIIASDIRKILQSIANYQHPRGIIITTKQFTIDDGELTTNMKLRRGTIINNFSSKIIELENKVNDVTYSFDNMSNFKEPVLLLV